MPKKWLGRLTNAVMPQHQSQFTPKMKANAELHLLSSLVWIDQYDECNGMMSFMESMRWTCLVQKQWTKKHRNLSLKMLFPNVFVCILKALLYLLSLNSMLCKTLLCFWCCSKERKCSMSFKQIILQNSSYL